MNQDSGRITGIIIGVLLSFSLYSHMPEPQELPMELVMHIPEYDITPVTNTGGAESELPELPEVFMTFPVVKDDSRITSPYGTRISPMLQIELKHDGVDIGAAGRAEVCAALDGVVKEHYLAPGIWNGKTYEGHEKAGGLIVIESEVKGRIVEHQYWHLSETRLSVVHEGKFIKAGTPIGRMGDTGPWADGIHLHFQMTIDGEFVNPILYLGQVLPEWTVDDA